MSPTTLGGEMSASEKLKALAGAMEPPYEARASGGWCELMVAEDEMRRIEALRNALPQIVALTEWAERTIQNFEEYGEVSFIPLIDSLEELDKALS